MSDLINPYRVIPHDSKGAEEAKILQTVINDVMATPLGRALQSATDACVADVCVFGSVSPASEARLREAREALGMSLRVEGCRLRNPSIPIKLVE